MFLQKRSVTLIEVLIGCALLSVLVSLVFGMWGELQKGHQAIEKERGLLGERVRFESTLDQLFLKIVPLKNGEDPLFYTDGEGGLIFLSHIGASMDPLFVDQVLCRIGKSQGGELIVDQWPDPIRHGVYPTHTRREVLLTGVTEISWSFFIPPDPNIIIENERIGPDTEEQRPPMNWSSVWKPGYKKIPLLLRLNVTKRRENVQYETYLPMTSYPLELSE